MACPASDGKTVVVSGKSFTVECGIDHAGGDITSLSVNTFYECIDACAKNTKCGNAILSGSACYLKDGLGPKVESGVWGAKLSPLSSGSSTTTTSTNGNVGSSTGTSTGTSTTATGPAASATSGIGAFSYVDCYSEVDGRALQGKTTAGNTVSNKACAAFCVGFQYFATVSKIPVSDPLPMYTRSNHSL